MIGRHVAARPARIQHSFIDIADDRAGLRIILAAATRLVGPVDEGLCEVTGPTRHIEQLLTGLRVQLGNRVMLP